MDGFGDLFGGIGEAFGELFGDAGAESAMGVTELFSPEGRRPERGEPTVYERYLCGKRRDLNINDR